MRKFLQINVSILMSSDFVMQRHAMRLVANAVNVVDRIPRRSAVLAGLAEQKPQLLEPSTKRVFRSHCESLAGVWRMTIGVAVSSQSYSYVHSISPCSSSSRMDAMPYSV